MDNLHVEPLKARMAYKVTRDGHFVALLVENNGCGWFYTCLGCKEQGPFDTKQGALADLLERGL